MVSLMTRHIRSRYAALAVLAASMLVGAVVLFAGGSTPSSANASASVPAVSAVSTRALDDPILQRLQAHQPSLNLESARQVIADSTGTVWVTKATDGEICLIEKPVNNADGVTSRYSCRKASDVAQEGLIAGVPGHWYGLLPDGASSVTAEVAQKATAVAVGANAFRLPADASSVTILGKTVDLPAPLPRSG
jgi:hypothetical protein